MENNTIPALLLTYYRSGLAEQTHYGYIKLLDLNGLHHSIGQDNGCVFYQRSCAKPLQASLLIDAGIADYFNLTDKEIAISCASHTGTYQHTNIIEQYLNKINCSKSDLLCGLHKPISQKAKDELLLTGKTEDILQNNCSGKHTFMLAYCRKENLDTSTYPDISHPLQQEIYAKLKELCGSTSELKSTKDGCGVPIWATTLEELGKGYLELFCSPKYNKITNAFLNNPYIIGGHERLDSEIINAGSNLIAKVGAGGLCVVVNLKTQQALVVKVCDADLKARTIITIKALLQLNWLTEQEIKTEPMKTFYNPQIKTLHDEIIGYAEANFDLKSFMH